MADMILGFKVMPEDGETETSVLKDKVEKTVTEFHESVQMRTLEAQDVGFGLKAIMVEIQIDEKQGSEELENKLNEIEEAGDVSVTKMDRL